MPPSRSAPTALLAVALLVPLAGCDWLTPRDGAQADRAAAREEVQARRLKAACSSQATYDRLKQVVFEEAVRIRNADPVNLDKLATFSVVRMENPVVDRHDPALDVTVCRGRFILEIPPGAERAFGGERRLAADVEYAAQSAADGGGLVYQIRGAEPIVYKLAAFDLRSRSPSDSQVAANAAAVPPPMAIDQAPDLADEPEPQARPVAAPPQSSPPQSSSPRPAPAPSPRPAPSHPERASAGEARGGADPANPSFDCRRARTRSEKMVCASDRLAALDRSMASRFYRALDRADPPTRAELRRSRDRFLAYRERCGSQSCIAQAYRDRMDEIDDIAGGR